MPNTDNNVSLNKRSSVRKHSAPRGTNGSETVNQNMNNQAPRQNGNPSQEARPVQHQENQQRPATNNNVRPATNQQPRRDPSQNLKKMQYGVTKIANIEGKVNGTFQNMALFYGNVTNYKSEDGIPKRVNEEFYNKKLDEFLNSEEGQEFEVPTEEDRAEAITYIKNYISNTRKEAERRAIEEQVQARLREEDEKRVAKLYGHDDGNDDENLYADPEYQDETAEQQPYNGPYDDQYEEDPQPQETYTEEPEPEPEMPVYNEPAEQPQYNPYNRNDGIQFDEPQVDDRDVRTVVQEGGNNKILLIVMTVLMALNLIATLVTGLLGPKLTKQSLSKMNMGELNVNGDVYTIPLSTIDVGDGETKTVFYALSTKNIDGEIINEAYPIGEWVVKGSGIVKDAKVEEPVAEPEEKITGAEKEVSEEKDPEATTETDETDETAESSENGDGEATGEGTETTEGSGESAESGTESTEQTAG